MNILFFGDIVGRSGRAIAKKWIPRLAKRNQADLVIVNGENLASWKGITPATAQEMFDAGVDVITSGNHIWKFPEVYPLLNKKNSRILRPMNYPPLCPGRGDVLVTTRKGEHVLVLNVQGRTFMKDAVDDPLRAIDRILKKYTTKKVDAVFVDFHAEATAEKMTFMHYLDGRVAAVVGTHTHVPTADEQVTTLGTAYVTDVGALYAQYSSIGVMFEGPLQQMQTQMSKSYELAKTGPFYVNAVVVTIDPKKKLEKKSQYGVGIGRAAKSIKHIVKLVQA